MLAMYSDRAARMAESIVLRQRRQRCREELRAWSVEPGGDPVRGLDLAYRLLAADVTITEDQRRKDTHGAISCSISALGGEWRGVPSDRHALPTGAPGRADRALYLGWADRSLAALDAGLASVRLDLGEADPGPGAGQTTGDAPVDDDARRRSDLVRHGRWTRADRVASASGHDASPVHGSDRGGDSTARKGVSA